MKATNVSSQMFSFLQGLNLYAYCGTLLQRHKMQRQMLHNWTSSVQHWLVSLHKGVITPLLFLFSHVKWWCFKKLVCISLKEQDGFGEYCLYPDKRTLNETTGMLRHGEISKSFQYLNVDNSVLLEIPIKPCLTAATLKTRLLHWRNVSFSSLC